jgi:hydroxypyruvate reductase
MTKAGTDAMRDAEGVFRAGLSRADPSGMVRGALRLEGSSLAASAEGAEARIELGDFNRVLAFGAGKASARMALALEEVLGERLSGGIVVVKDGHREELRRVRAIEAAHPFPDARSRAAAEATLELARSGDERTLFIGLVSGGGSSLLCLPAPGLSLEDKAEATRLLVSCGADIREINCVRKHLSAIKGGRLAAAFGKARVLNLVLSDVVGDDLGVIASGLTAPDPTTFRDALAIIEARGLGRSMPAATLRVLEAGAGGAIEETPKPGSAAFERVTNLVIGSNRQALLAAAEEARRLGYGALVLGSRLEGEARELGRVFLALARGIREDGLPLGAPACLLAGGESTVTLRGGGRGGRNQEMALAFLAAAETDPRALDGICFLSAGSDGTDGPTDAAGAFACPEILDSALAAGASPSAYLADNDSYGFFSRVGGHLVTGPTRTNVCDLQVLLARPRRA